MSTPQNQKCCFVVMGFGIKTDYATGRKLDLDKSYRLLIKPVVEGKGLSCVRADEIRHSGSIDVPKYQELLQADVVVADLSTANVNAFYELGIRHALKPHTTIVISEDKLPYPFDLNHISITKYTHLGDAIDFDEVERLRAELGKTLEAVLASQQTDSPVYTFLKLTPPSLADQVQEAAAQIQDALQKNQSESSPTTSGCVSASDQEKESLSLLTQQGEQALQDKDFVKAKALFHSALLMGNANSNTTANDSYLIHRLALATYKAKLPNEISALKEATSLLEKLDLDHTNDSETVALAGAIEKRLYENGQGDYHLSNSILYFQRASYLLFNRYNLINLAFLLNCRVDSSLDTTKEDQIADMVWANRIRSNVLDIYAKEEQEIANRKDRVATSIMQDKQSPINSMSNLNEQSFWIFVNKAEAYFGLGMFNQYAQATEHADWMMESFQQ